MCRMKVWQLSGLTKINSFVSVSRQAYHQIRVSRNDVNLTTRIDWYEETSITFDDNDWDNLF